jgi:hypothetical protein
VRVLGEKMPDRFEKEFWNKSMTMLAMKTAEGKFNKDEITAFILTRLDEKDAWCYARENGVYARYKQDERDAISERFTNLVHDFSMSF